MEDPEPIHGESTLIWYDSESSQYGVYGKLLSKYLVELGMCKSRSEAERMMKAGAVEWDGRKVTNPRTLILADMTLMVVND